MRTYLLGLQRGLSGMRHKDFRQSRGIQETLDEYYMNSAIIIITVSVIQGDILSPRVSFYLNPIGNAAAECTSIFSSISISYVIELTNI